mmetsp:Transcript_7777/g.12360  ORF Transcript_7777/g.12360 Transcript_7777/m.12360 type:complete len:506 (-) Transcript_7777:618-2135(-)
MHGGVSIGGVVHGEAKEIGKPRQYILAYGSLMSTESRGKTGMLGRAWPVVVKGIRVGWSNVYPTATFLGAASAVTVEIRQNSTKEDHSNKGRIWEGKEERKDREKYELQGGGEDRTLAIMLEIPQDKDAQEIISAFDQREGAKYVRSRVSLNNISLWRPSAPVAAAAGISESSRYYYEDDRLPWDNREEEEEEEEEEDQRRRRRRCSSERIEKRRGGEGRRQRQGIEEPKSEIKNTDDGGKNYAPDKKREGRECCPVIVAEEEKDDRDDDQVAKQLHNNSGDDNYNRNKSSRSSNSTTQDAGDDKKKKEQEQGGIINAEEATAADESDTTHYVWIYMMKSWEKRSPSSAVLQSYVDVVLTGALEYHEEFCKEWITACYQWGGCVKHDRREPMYPRCLRAMPEELSSKIDSLLPAIHLESRRGVNRRSTTTTCSKGGGGGEGGGGRGGRGNHHQHRGSSKQKQQQRLHQKGSSNGIKNRGSSSNTKRTKKKNKSRRGDHNDRHTGG